MERSEIKSNSREGFFILSRLDGFISRWLVRRNKVCLKTVIFMRCARLFVCINYHCSSKAVPRDLRDTYVVSVKLILV